MKTRKTSLLFFPSLLLYNIESKSEFKNCLKHKLFPYKINSNSGNYVYNT